jgi:GNAT superfamily N-acetyltransferase
VDSISVRTLVATIVILVRDISRDEYKAHLKTLDKESLIYRFSRIMTEESIDIYVDSIPRSNHILGAISTVYGDIAAAAHLAVDDDESQCEVGISTDLRYRRKGVAKVLMEHILAMCTNRGIHQLYMTCLTDNKAIINLCKKVGLAVVSSRGESETVLELPSVSVASLNKELAMTNMVVADALMKPYKANWQAWLRKNR